jgi:hypothetical protein
MACARPPGQRGKQQCSCDRCRSICAVHRRPRRCLAGDRRGVTTWQRLDRHVEQVTAPRDGAHQRTRLVAERATDLHQALGDRVVRDRRMPPDGVQQFFAPDQPARMAHHIQQELEALGPQPKLASRAEQGATPHVEHEGVEAVGVCSFCRVAHFRLARLAHRGLRFRKSFATLSLPPRDFAAAGLLALSSVRRSASPCSMDRNGDRETVNPRGSTKSSGGSGAGP